jgi:sirohydrochlorin ferrochelatase
MPEVVLIAHGSPSDPAPAEAALQALAGVVAEALPGWVVRSATLAAPGSVKLAFDGLSASATVFPVFMSDGWILRHILPKLLAEAGREATEVRTPLGQLPGFRDHCARMVLDVVAEADMPMDQTTVVLAAHGSARGPLPAAWANGLAQDLARLTGIGTVTAAFLEQEPALETTLARVAGPAICLPVFATNCSHAIGDVPEAARASGFAGRVLPAAGTVPGVVSLIAQALRDTSPRRDAA